MDKSNHDRAAWQLDLCGLFYRAGKPETFESDQQTSMYHLTAAPTLFVQWYIVPTVELDWAMASQNLLKFSILVHDLETTIEPADWICNPHITMDPPVPRRLRGYEMGVVYGASGEFIRAITNMKSMPVTGNHSQSTWTSQSGPAPIT